MNVPFDALTKSEVLEHIQKYLEGTLQHHIATANPEMLLHAQHDEEFRHILHQTSINTPDGIGIIWAANVQKNSLLTSLFKLLTLPFHKPKSPIPERITGADLFLEICQEAAIKHQKIFLLGGKEGVAEKTKQHLEKLYPEIQIVGTHEGTHSMHEQEKIKDIINDASPDILFVAYGAPAQEKWIARNLQKIPSVKVAIGVGGTFDFVSGVIPRAPLLLRKIGLEWLYRLIKEPKKRWRRIKNATIIFPWRFLRERDQK